MIEYSNFIEKYKDFNDRQLEDEFENRHEAILARAILDQLLDEDALKGYDTLDELFDTYTVIDINDYSDMSDVLYELILETFNNEVRDNYSLELYKCYLDMDSLMEDKIRDASLEDYYETIYVDFEGDTYGIIEL